MAELTKGRIQGVGKCFIWSGSFLERKIPQEAKLKWHSKAKVWYTQKESVAQSLIQYATVDVKEYLEELKNNNILSRAKDTDLVVPAPDSLEYLPFQRAGIHYASLRKNTLIADEQGLGKTIQAIGFANLMDFRSVLIVCPASLKLNWKKEFLKWQTNDTIIIEIAEGRKYKFTTVIPEKPTKSMCVHIVNYDILTGDVLSALSPQYDLGIYDEIHYCKNPKAKRTLAVLGKKNGLYKRCTYNLALSGTPISNRPVEMFSVISALCPDAIGGMGYWDYAQKYCAMRQGPFGIDVSGASNKQELQTNLRSHFMVRRLKENVLKDLPAKRYQLIELSSNKQTKEILKLEKNVDTKEFLKGKIDGLTIGELAEMRRRMAIAKLPACMDHIKMLLESIDKIVIFAHHREVVAQIVEFLEKLKCNPVQIVGGTPNPKRQEAVDTFQNDKSCRAFVGNIKAAGVGITLTAASNVVFIESSWVPGEIAQAVDRCHRIGQKASVLAQFLVVEGSLDAVVLSAALKKAKVIEQILD